MPNSTIETRTYTGQADSTCREQLALCEQRLLDAMRQRDAAALEQLLHPEVLFVLPSGQLIGKEDDLAAYRAGLLQVERLDVREQQLQVLGATATVVVTFELRGHYQGQPFGGLFRYLRVWQEQAPGQWQVIAGSGLQLPPA